MPLYPASAYRAVDPSPIVRARPLRDFSEKIASACPREREESGRFAPSSDYRDDRCQIDTLPEQPFYRNWPNI
jgi:hypothetical protein